MQTPEEKAAAAKAAAEKKAADKAATDKVAAEKSAAEKTQIAAVGRQKITFLRSHPDFAYHPGESGELSDVQADALVKGGFARIADETAELPTDEIR